MNLGETNDHLLQFESSLSIDTPALSLATSMLVLMVRGLFSKLTFPYAQFACCKLSGDLLVDPVWEAVSRLERQGFRVLALTCDGASTNRKLWKIHSNGEEMTYKVNNIFAPEGVRPLFFISDPPHLLKTIRNCWWNSKRNLWVSSIMHMHHTALIITSCVHYMFYLYTCTYSIFTYSAMASLYHGVT